MASNEEGLLMFLRSGGLRLHGHDLLFLARPPHHLHPPVGSGHSLPHLRWWV